MQRSYVAFCMEASEHCLLQFYQPTTVDSDTGLVCFSKFIIQCVTASPAYAEQIF